MSGWFAVSFPPHTGECFNHGPQNQKPGSLVAGLGVVPKIGCDDIRILSASHSGPRAIAKKFVHNRIDVGCGGIITNSPHYADKGPHLHAIQDASDVGEAGYKSNVIRGGAIIVQPVAAIIVPIIGPDGGSANKNNEKKCRESHTELLTQAPHRGNLVRHGGKICRVGFGRPNVYGARIAAHLSEDAASLCPSATGHLRVRRLGLRRRRRSTNPSLLGHPFGRGPKHSSSLRRTPMSVNATPLSKETPAAVVISALKELTSLPHGPERRAKLEAIAASPEWLRSFQKMDHCGVSV